MSRKQFDHLVCESMCVCVIVGILLAYIIKSNVTNISVKETSSWDHLNNDSIVKSNLPQCKGTLCLNSAGEAIIEQQLNGI